MSGDELFPEDLNDISRCRQLVGGRCLLKPNGFWARLRGLNHCDYYVNGCVNFQRPVSRLAATEAAAEARVKIRDAIAEVERNGSIRVVALRDIDERVFNAIKGEFIAEGHHAYFCMGFAVVELKNLCR